jgi:hypothetical protein
MNGIPCLGRERCWSRRSPKTVDSCHRYDQAIYISPPIWDRSAVHLGGREVPRRNDRQGPLASPLHPLVRNCCNGNLSFFTRPPRRGAGPHHCKVFRPPGHCRNPRCRPQGKYSVEHADWYLSVGGFAPPRQSITLCNPRPAATSAHHRIWREDHKQHCNCQTQ